MTDSADSSTRFILPADSPLPANLAAWWAADPALAAELESALDGEPYALEPSRAGPPTVAVNDADGRRIYLHSRHQPIVEAAKLVESIPTEEKSLFCIHGFGLGYHIELLFEKAGPEAMLIVFEPDLRLLRTAFANRDFSSIIRSGRLIILTHSDSTSLMLRLGKHQAMLAAGVAFVSHPASLQACPAFHREVQSAISEFASFCRTNLQTMILNGRRTAENIARNIGWYVATPGVDDLANRHAKQPAIIVSAGPSLRKNQHLLRSAAGKAVLIAVQTMLQPLLEMGIEPDFATSLDYHDICTRFFEKLPRNLRTQLVAEPKASPAIFSLYPGQVRLLGSEYADLLLRPMNVPHQRLRAGATVAHLAFYLAEFMGCDPIIFVGQDLGFSDGLCYTPGTSYEDVWRPELGRFCTMEMKQWEHIARERPILKRIADHHGRPMYTEHRLFAYLQQFERDFATSPARIIDATEGGAAKKGAEVMALQEAIGRFCTADIRAPRPAEVIYHWDKLPACLDSLQQRRAECAQIADIARQTLPLLEELRAKIDDEPRANRLIARIDALRFRLRSLDGTYDLVTQLSQETQIVRFRSDRQIAASRLTGVEKQRRQIARDILNVQAVVEATARFQRLVDCVIDEVRSQEASHQRQVAA